MFTIAHILNIARLSKSIPRESQKDAFVPGDMDTKFVYDLMKYQSWRKPVHIRTSCCSEGLRGRASTPGIIMERSGEVTATDRDFRLNSMLSIRSPSFSMLQTVISFLCELWTCALHDFHSQRALTVCAFQ